MNVLSRDSCNSVFTHYSIAVERLPLCVFVIFILFLTLKYIFIMPAYYSQINIHVPARYGKDQTNPPFVLVSPLFLYTSPFTPQSDTIRLSRSRTYTHWEKELSRSNSLRQIAVNIGCRKRRAVLDMQFFHRKQAEEYMAAS